VGRGKHQEESSAVRGGPKYVRALGGPFQEEREEMPKGGVNLEKTAAIV